MVSPTSEWTLYLLLWMGGLLTTSPRTRIELKMNGGRGQWWGGTKWTQTHETHRHHARKSYNPQGEAAPEGKMMESGMRKASDPKGPGHSCEGLTLLPLCSKELIRLQGTRFTKLKKLKGSGETKAVQNLQRVFLTLKIAGFPVCRQS